MGQARKEVDKKWKGRKALKGPAPLTGEAWGTPPPTIESMLNSAKGIASIPKLIIEARIVDEAMLDRIDVAIEGVFNCDFERISGLKNEVQKAVREAIVDG